MGGPSGFIQKNKAEGSSSYATNHLGERNNSFGKLCFILASTNKLVKV